MLKSSLETRCYEYQSVTDPYIFIRKDSMLLMLGDNFSILFKKDPRISDSLISSLKKGNENLNSQMKEILLDM